MAKSTKLLPSLAVGMMSRRAPPSQRLPRSPVDGAHESGALTLKHITDLGHDETCAILGMLRYVEDRCLAMGVCVTWRRAAGEPMLWKECVFRTTAQPPRHVLTRPKGLLERLELGRSQYCYERWTMPASGILSCVASSPRLEVLDLRFCGNISTPSLTTVLQCHPRLRILRVAGIQYLERNYFAQMKSVIPAGCSIDVSVCMSCKMVKQCADCTHCGNPTCGHCIKGCAFCPWTCGCQVDANSPNVYCVACEKATCQGCLGTTNQMLSCSKCHKATCVGCVDDEGDVSCSKCNKTVCVGCVDDEINTCDDCHKSVCVDCDSMTCCAYCPVDEVTQCSDCALEKGDKLMPVEGEPCCNDCYEFHLEFDYEAELEHELEREAKLADLRAKAGHT